MLLELHGRETLAELTTVSIITCQETSGHLESPNLHLLESSDCFPVPCCCAARAAGESSLFPCLLLQ